MLQTKQPFKISGHNYTSSDFQCETCKDMKKQDKENIEETLDKSI